MKISYYLDRVMVIGTIWMPAVTCAQEKTLSARDIEDITDLEEPGITRRNVELWLNTNSGDFQCVDDFRVEIGDWESDWENPDSELVYDYCMFPPEEDYNE